MSSSFAENLPEKFVQNVTDLCGDKGLDWLEALPQILEELEFKWDINAEDHFHNLSYNYVASCIDPSDKPLVLKIALPLRKPEIFREAQALMAFAKCGGVKVVNQDANSRAILIERLLPGKNLKELFEGNKDDAIEPAINVLKRLSPVQVMNETLPLLDDWFKAFEKAEVTAFPSEPLLRARKLVEELNLESSGNSLLHGDFHH